MTPTENLRPSNLLGAGGSPQFQLRTALVAIRCWWHVALPIGLLLAAAVSGGLYAWTKPTYTASRWMLIMERPPSLLHGQSVDDSRRFVSNQIELLRSPLVLEPILSDPAVASTPELANEIDPVLYLRTKLRIKALGQSEYFEIAFTSRSAEKAALIVDKVAEEYFALQQKQQNQSSQRTIELLQQQQIAQQQEVKQLRKRLQDLSKQLFGKDAFPLQPEERKPASDPLADLESQLVRAEVEQAALTAHIQAEQEQFNKESFEPSQTAIETLVEQHPRVRAARQEMEKSQQKLAGTKSVASNPQHVTITAKQVRDQQDALDRALVEARAEVKAATEKNARATKQDYIAQLQAQRGRLEVTVAFLQDRLSKKRGVHQQLAGDSLEFELAKAEHDRAQLFHEAISSRILAMQTEQRAPERIELLGKAKVPTRVDEEVPIKKMGMAAAMGLFAPFGLAVLLEILFRRVSERGQIESVTDLALVGEVTALPRRSSARTSWRTAGGREVQLYEESIDGLRTLLMLFESTRGHKVLSVTSAVSGEGKTSVAAQLAVSIASATNRPTLLIDGDMRSPDVHRIFDVDLGPGLCEVLSGECPVNEAIETDFSAHLHLLTAGQLAVSPHRIMGGGKFHDLINSLREMYEFIIIDTPPILPASEALLMNSAADSAILCARRDFSRMGQISEASKRLRSSGVNLAGAVLSGVPAHEYSSRYGAYYYTRAQGLSHAATINSPAGQAS